jgi:hypothetical protein
LRFGRWRSGSCTNCDYDMDEMEDMHLNDLDFLYAQSSPNREIVQELDNGSWTKMTLWMARSGSSMPLRASRHAQSTASLLPAHLEIIYSRLFLSLEPFHPLAIALIHVLFYYLWSFLAFLQQYFDIPFIRLLWVCDRNRLPSPIIRKNTYITEIIIFWRLSRP